MLSFIAPQDLSSPSHVGFVVKDADKTAEFFLHSVLGRGKALNSHHLKKH